MMNRRKFVIFLLVSMFLVGGISSNSAYGYLDDNLESDVNTTVDNDVNTIIDNDELDDESLDQEDIEETNQVTENELEEENIQVNKQEVEKKVDLQTTTEKTQKNMTEPSSYAIQKITSSQELYQAIQNINNDTTEDVDQYVIELMNDITVDIDHDEYMNVSTNSENRLLSTKKNIVVRSYDSNKKKINIVKDNTGDKTGHYLCFGNISYENIQFNGEGIVKNKYSFRINYGVASFKNNFDNCIIENIYSSSPIISLGRNDNYIKNCEFINCESTSVIASIVALYGNSKIINTKFMNNIGSCIENKTYYEGTALIQECTFKNNIGDKNKNFIYGSPIRVNQVSASENCGLRIDKCRFEDNQAYHGGAIFLRGAISTDNSKYNVDVSSCTFKNNAIYGTDVDYFGWLGDGGAIYAQKVNLNIKDCTFDNNQSPLSRGGALYTDMCDVTINDSTFKNNSSRWGGAMNINNHSNLKANNITVTKNQAVLKENYGEGAGGISIYNHSQAEISSSRITNNYSDLSCGGIQVFINSQLTLKDSEVSGNVADAGGAGIAIHDNFEEDETYSKVTLDNCVIRKNIANSQLDSEHKELATPKSGGGAGVFVSDGCQLEVKNNTKIQENVCKNEGPGAGIYACFGAQVEVEDSYIINNETDGNGGGIYLYGSGQYTGWSHENNQVAQLDNAHGTGSSLSFHSGRISGNTAKDGGGIYVGGTNMQTDTIEGTGAVCTINEGVISSNHALNQGGGVYVEAGNNENLPGGTFQLEKGALYNNIAGKKDNTGSSISEAGAELFAEGQNSSFTVIDAKEMYKYIKDEKNSFVEIRNVIFDNWYYDYSDFDTLYGKNENKEDNGVSTGRYETSLEADQYIHEVANNDHQYRALILGIQFLEDDITIDVLGDKTSQSDQETKKNAHNKVETSDDLDDALQFALLSMVSSLGIIYVLRRRKESE